MTDTHYTLFGGPRSRAFRAIWMLEELELPYTHRPSPPQAADVRAVSPTGKIPVLLVGEDAICDSSAILTYLADHHQALTYAPGTLDRARQDAMLFRVLDELDAVVWTAARHSFVLPEAERVPAIKPSLKTEFARNATRLAEALADQPFVMGAQMTIPDIVLTHCLGWSLMAKFDPLPDPLRAYLGRMRKRPAYLRASG